MKNKWGRSVLALLLTVSLLFSFAVQTVAEEGEIYGYKVDTTEFHSPVREAMGSLILVKNEDGSWLIRANGEEIGNKTGSSFSAPYGGYTLSFSGVGSDKIRVSASYPVTTLSATIPSSVTIRKSSGDGLIATFSSSASGANASSATAELSESGFYSFGSLSFTHNGKTYTITDLKINTQTGVGSFYADGKVYSFNVGTGTPVYLEWWVDNQTVNTDYFATGLGKYSFPVARSISYSTSEIDNALSNYSITMRNNATGLTQTSTLYTVLTYWARKEGAGTSVGDGSYNEYTSGVRVVKQWYELSADQKTLFGGSTESDAARRPFAVYPSSLTFPAVTSDRITITKMTHVNISWPESAWIGPYSNAASARNALDSSYGIARYRKATLTWRPFGDWETYTRIDDACDSDYCHYETTNGYRRTAKTYSYTGYSGYDYTTIVAAERAGYSYASPDTCRATRERNTLCGVESYTYGGYTGYDYTSIAEAERSGCNYATTSNCKTTTKTSSACGVDGYTYSGWSDYIYTAKEADGRTYASECKSKTVTDSACGIAGYTYSGWSDYIYTAKEADAKTYASECKSKTVTNSSCGVKDYTYSNYSGYIYTSSEVRGGSAPNSDYCKSSSVTSSICGTTTTYTNWGSEKTAKYGSYTSQCTSRSATSSVCGTTNKTCTLYKCPTSRTSTVTRKRSCKLPKSVEGDTCSCTGSSCTCTIGSCTSYNSYTSSTSYSYTYGTYQTAKYGSYTTQCTSSSQTSSTCGTTNKTCTLYTCPQSKTTSNKTCTLYSCPSSKTANYNSCSLYSCPSSRTANYNTCSLYSCPSTRTANYKTCTFYSCPTTRTTVYNECTLYSCPGTRNVTSSSSSYVTSCTAKATMEEDIICDSVPLIRTSTAVAGTYDGWTSLGRSVNVSEDTENYIYQYMVNNGEYSYEDTKGTSSTVGNGKMYVKDEASGTQSVLIAVSGTTSYPDFMGTQTSDSIYEAARKAGTGATQANYVNVINKSSTPEDPKYDLYNGGKWSTFSYVTVGDHNTEGDKAYNDFLNEERYIPFVFITAHWRATKKGVTYDNITANGATYSEYVVATESTDAYGTALRKKPGTPTPDPEDIEKDSRETKVIYFDYKDPLTNYDAGSIPENWQGYEALIDEIKATDFADAKIEVTLTKKDLRDMREWMNEHPDAYGTCAMIREFSHIFTKTSPELDAWLKSGSTSCKGLG